MRNLLAQPQVSSRDRLTLYTTTIAFQWATSVIIAWRCWVHGISPAALGLDFSNASRILPPTLLGGALLFGLQWLNMRRLSQLAPDSHGLLQSIAARILPQSRLEILVFFPLALTVAVCEEFFYRGFAMAALERWGWPNPAVILSTSLLFGLGHIYQGRPGVLSTILLGALFALAKTLYGSLIPPMVWHFTVDMAAALRAARSFRTKLT